MSKFKESLKEEIKEEIGDLIYEKAKAEVKSKIKNRLVSAKKKFLSFFGIRDTKKQRISRISKEIQDDENILLSDTSLGIIELFTVKFVHSIFETAGSVLSPQNSHESNIEKHENHR